MWRYSSWSSVTKLCLTLYDPMDCSLPGSSGIIQAGILEWVAIFFSKGSSRPRDQTLISCIGRWIHIMSNQSVHIQTAFNARMESPHFCLHPLSLNHAFLQICPQKVNRGGHHKRRHFLHWVHSGCLKDLHFFLIWPHSLATVIFYTLARTLALLGLGSYFD